MEAASRLVTVPAGTRVDALVAAAGLSWQDAFDAQVAAEEYPTAEYLLATARSSALPAVDAELDPDVAQTLQTTAALGNAAALAGVTVLAAQACGVSDRKGRLAPGYDADLLAVDGDPLADLAALARPVAVLHQGVWVR